MAYISQYQYYENGGANPQDENWGSYQYVSLEAVSYTHLTLPTNREV